MVACWTAPTARPAELLDSHELPCARRPNRFRLRDGPGLPGLRMKLASQYQRDEIRRLMREVGTFDPSTVTIMQRTLGVNDHWIGQSIDAWLSNLSFEEAADVIGRLKNQVCA